MTTDTVRVGAGSVVRNTGFVNCNWSEEHEHIFVTNFILL